MVVLLEKGGDLPFMNYYVKKIFTFFTFLTTKAATVEKILLKFLKKLEKSQ